MAADRVKPLEGRALPGILAEIAGLTSTETAIAVARAFGGRRLSLPREPKPDHPLSRLVGHRAARIICHALGGDVHRIPSARPLLHWHDARLYRARGWSHARIARAIGVGENHVRRLLAGFGAIETIAVAEAALPPACPSCGRRLRRAAKPRHCDPRQLVLFDPDSAPFW